MKIKVDKEEYEQLLERVEQLEKDNDNSWDKFRRLARTLREEIDSYFEHKCQVVMIKRDKDKIVAEVREQALNNIFKEQDK